MDRIIRVLAAIGLFYAAMTWPMASAVRIVLSVVGGLLLVTSITGFCGIYKLFNWSTSKNRPGEPAKKMDDSSDTQEPLFKGQ